MVLNDGMATEKDELFFHTTLYNYYYLIQVSQQPRDIMGEAGVRYLLLFRPICHMEQNTTCSMQWVNSLA